MNKTPRHQPMLSKREFLHLCCAALGSCILGLDPLSVITGNNEAAASSLLGPEGPGKWSKEAWFCKDIEGGIKCLKCPHSCVLAANDIGICRNRINYQGIVYSIAYGNPCAVHIDPIEKKPLYHFLPATRAFSIAVAGCNLRCLNCQNWEISQKTPLETRNVDLMPDQVVAECLKAGCESIAYTYSEPTTFYEYAFDTATIARTHKIKNVWKSSGYINEKPLRKLCAVIDAANIDLKSFDTGVYEKLNGATLDPVLRTLKIFKEEGVWLEITNLVIPTWTDNLEMIKRMCDWLSVNGLQDCPLHFSRFSPLYKLNQLPSTPVSTLNKARDIAKKAGVRYVYVGNVPGHPAENSYCHNCGKLIIERRGYVITTKHIKNGSCTFCQEDIPGVWN
ncbi:MAG: AmmeMemoRadiSam system radical SAM enzyme [Desulfobulbaceae bacterium]|nr:AmmeMemoRadiSam system radical SAM enzyme [Desulfobulbaceae bacterium]